MTKFFFKFKKLYFCPIFGPFPLFWGKKVFPENLALSRTTSQGFLATCQNSEKSNDPIPRKPLGRWKDGPFQLLTRAY